MNTTIRVTSYTMPAAPMGPANPLPDLKTVAYVHSGVTVGPHVTEEEGARIGYGMVQSILPYKIQDGYTREQKLRSFHAVVLENDFLKAVFLPEVGGRLWSLFHKGENRELLHVNPVFQPCHLALRNAWFSGGVEWNVGIKGHTPYTCDPLHTEIVEYKNMKVLRMYEYERIRRCVYCLEAYLPDDSDILYIKTRIHNTSGETVPMYWWSNIAVNETEDTRVLAPTEQALETFYTGNSYWLDKVDMPFRNDVDCSYPRNVKISTDFFYCVPKARKKWICAVEKDGKGLFEASTMNLTGKKIFQWGMTAGGRHWQEFLSVPGSAYLEIQSGLARTQLEHIPMENDETWEFVEAYGLVSTDPQEAFSANYTKATSHAEDTIYAHLQERTPEDLQKDPTWKELSVQKGQLVMTGSGWGALENMRRCICGEAPLSQICSFSTASLGTEQADWICLLREGSFADRSVFEEPASYMSDSNWMELLSSQTDWYGKLLYGVALYGLGQVADAKKAFLDSFSARESGWACRNIAQLEKLDSHYEEAAQWLSKAVSLLPWSRHIWAEYFDLLNAHGQSQTVLDLYPTMPPDIQEHPRLIIQKIVAKNRTGHCDEAQELLESGLVLPDIREGEASLAAVWEEVQQTRVQNGSDAKALPYELDFRMH